MPKISPELKRQLAEQPDETFDLIVRTAGDASPHLDWLAANEMQVKRQFRLSPGVAISCRGEDALKLLDVEWVVSVEIDEVVKAM